MSQRRAHISRAQKIKLIEILATKPELRTGKFHTNFTYRDAQKEWGTISGTLNSIPGSEKNWKEWRKTWHDLLSKTKKKTADIKKTRSGTGGGPPALPLDDVEEEISRFLNPNTVSGHRGVEESVVTLDVISPPPLLQEQVPVWVDDNIENASEVVVTPPASFCTTEQREVTMRVDGRINSSGPRRRQSNIKTLLKEKIELKKKYVEAKINYFNKNLELQKEKNDILKDISNNLKKL